MLDLGGEHGHAAAPHERVRIVARRQEDATPPETGFDEHREAPRRRAPARFVAVEARDDPFREAAEHAELVDREGRAERRDGLADARFGDGDHVQVALDDDHTIARPDRLARETQAVERLPLLEERRFGAVQVFRRRIAGDWGPGEHASAEGDHAPGEGVDREHEPVAKAVVEPPVGAASDQARRDRILE